MKYQERLILVSHLQTSNITGRPCWETTDFSQLFNSQILPKTVHIWQKSPLNQLCNHQTPSLPMSTLSLKSPRYLKPWPKSLDGLIQEKKQGLIDHEVYEKISKNQYLDLRRDENIPKENPSTCISVVKNDKDGKPLRAKYRIVVLGNSEDRLYQKIPTLRSSFKI